MLELRLVQGSSLLKKILESIKDLIFVANFDCSATGFSLQAMDSNQLALATLLLRPEGFQHYRCDQSISMGMNLGYMYNMLKDAGNDDMLTIKAEHGSNTVTFNLGTENNFSENEMNLMDLHSDHLTIPEVEYDASVRISSAAFSEICGVLIGIGDSVVISVTQRGVEFFTKGDSGKKNIVRRHNPEEGTTIEMNEPVSLTFSLRYLNSFTKASPLSNKVTINLCSDMPLMVEYKIAKMRDLRFHLCPVLG